MLLAPDPAASPADLELGSSYGVMLLSTIIVAALYGITVLQSLYYYENFPKDPRIVKLTVAGVWFLDTLTLILDAHAVYFYLITNYANPPALQTEIWSTQVELLVTYTIVLIVQIFFIFRIYQLRPHLWYIPALLGLLAFASYCMVIAIFITVVHDDNWAATNRPEVTRPLTANWVLGNLVDISITVALCWYLWSEKLAIRESTNMMINRIIVFSVNRGAIAAVVQILTLLTKFIWPQTLVWLAFHNALSKVYANSMLATLNARVTLRKMVMESKVDETGPPSAFSHAPSRPVSMNPTVAMGRQLHDRHQIATLQFARTTATGTNHSTAPGYYDAARSFDSRNTATTITTTMDITEQYPRPLTKLGMTTDHSYHHAAATSVRPQQPFEHDVKYNGALSRTQTQAQRTARTVGGDDDAYSYSYMQT